MDVDKAIKVSDQEIGITGTLGLGLVGLTLAFTSIMPKGNNQTSTRYSGADPISTIPELYAMSGLKSVQSEETSGTTRPESNTRFTSIEFVRVGEARVTS